MFSAKNIIFVVVIVLLAAGNAFFFMKSRSLGEEVDALLDALSRPSGEQSEMEQALSDVNATLQAQRSENEGLIDRVATLDELTTVQKRGIAELEIQVRALETELLRSRQSATATEQVTATQQTSTSIEPAVSATVASAAERSASVTPPSAADDDAGAVKHVVQRGDLLQDLARKYYGDPTAWRRILAANQDVVSDAKSLIPGMVLVIPGVTQ